MSLFEHELSAARAKGPVEGRLHAEHLADLRKSGLSDGTIDKARLATVSAEAAEDYLGYPPETACLAFEYPGTPPYYRLKPLRPLVGSDGNARKYLAAQGSGNRLYLPPGFILPGDIANATIPIVITEGEKKALKLCQEGFKAVGVSGVWCWRTSEDSTGQTKVLDEFDAIRWTGRTVFICFDSDAAANGDVQQAEEALAEELDSRGTTALIVRLPQDGDEKVGVDDYLVAHGKEELVKLLREAKPLVGTYFDGYEFVPLRLTWELERRDHYIHAVDPEEGSGRLYVYCDGVYRPAAFVSNMAQELLEEETRSHRIDEAVAALKRDVAVTNDRLNHEKELVNVLNGMLNPFSGKLEPHDPAYLSTIQHPVTWNPDATCELLDKFLKVTCGDYAELVCELAGYLLLPINVIKKLLVWHGDVDTGKSTLMNLFCGLIGERHYASVSPLSLGDRFMGAQLENKLVNFFDDLPPGRIGDPALLKILTGGCEFITIEPKHVNAYKARNLCRMVFAANELPSCADKSNAWYERLCIIPFRHQVPDADKDPGLRERFAHDTAIREAMLVKAVAGLRRLQERGWRLEGSEEELAAYREKNDPVMAFIAESCTVGLTECVKRTDLRDAYEQYCKTHELFTFSSARKFYERVRGDRRFGEKKVNGELYFTGLSLSEGGR